ncbi:MAG: protein-L-isoaspartate(D-aspartate) O-methyltransferase [Nitrospirota bacterium]|nr:protein-L-isoaspartate(D-aspartate) O-methyltransferase [Nitrospirota bacterium]
MEPRRVGDSYGGYRTRLVEQLRARGFRDMAVLAAVGQVPRHLFVPEALRGQAYEDTSLPIGNRQTISQPSTHARYLEALQLTGKETVLEVGTGSGYLTALLSRLADHVISIERIPDLAAAARMALQEAGYSNATVVVGDGTLGKRSLGPYHAILVSAVGPSVPKPLTEQLADGGRLVMPLMRETEQELLRVTRHGRDLIEETLGPAHFVPLVGKHGFEEEQG